MKKIFLVFALLFSVYTNAQWIQKGLDIDGEASGDRSGAKVAMSADGSSLAIGAYSNNGTAGIQSGHVRVYNWNGTTWIQKGLDIDGEAASDLSGWGLYISANGNIVAVGAYMNDGTTGGITDNKGHVRVYEWTGTAWIQKGLDIDGEATGDWSGYAVSMSSDGNLLAIGARLNDGTGQDAGHVRVFEWDGAA